MENERKRIMGKSLDGEGGSSHFASRFTYAVKRRSLLIDLTRNSVKHTMRGVAFHQAQAFVKKYLSGELAPASFGQSENKLSFHLPKIHSEHKCRSCSFSSRAYRRKPGL